MRLTARAFWRALASILLLAGISAPARADIAPVGPAKEIFSWPGLLIKTYVAFDDVNQVYLVVWGPQEWRPAQGIILNVAGEPLTHPFAISDPHGDAGYVRVTAGGGRFLVTYAKTISENRIYHQYARFVTYTAGSGVQFPSGEIFIDDLNREGRSGGLVYAPTQNAFLVTWAKPVGVPQSFVRRVNMDGTLGAIHRLTDGSDGQSGPEIACDTSGTCLTVGFAWDTVRAHTRQEGATWSRLIDAASGAPVQPLRYLDVASLQEDQTIAFNPSSNRYTVAWVRARKDVIGQGVDTQGNALGLHAIKMGTGRRPGCDFQYGMLSASLSYNAGSGTMAIGMADDCGIAYVSELDGNGAPIPGQFHQITGLITDNNHPAIGVNAGAAQFLVIHNYLHVAPRARIYQANATNPGPGPGPGPGPDPTPVTIDLSPQGAPNGSWFLAEGVAGQSFNSFYLVANENAVPVSARAYFTDDNGHVRVTTFDVPAHSRHTVDLGKVIGEGAYASVFQSLTPGADIVVERSVYFGHNLEGSTVGTATKLLNDTWFFAEGSRGGELFANYFLLFNPTQNPVTVTGAFYPSHGDPVVRTFTIAPQARYTVIAKNIDELANKDFSSTFAGNGYFVAERAMYWGEPWHGGTASMGATGLQSRWLFAEGVANGVMETFYQILNPNEFPIQVTASYYPEVYPAFTQTFTVDAKARYTVYLNRDAGEIGPAAADFTSQANFLAERSIYWGGRVEGTNVIGVNTPAMAWSLPEGADGGDFYTYTLIANPNHHDVTLDVTLFFDDGTRVTVPESLRPVVPARGRLTMDMRHAWLPLLESVEQRTLLGRSYSTRISVFQQTGPVVVEHAIYYNLQPGILWRSGGASVGIPR